MDVKVEKVNLLTGEIEIPADKSISHRAIILGALTKGSFSVSNFSLGSDCKSTLEIFKKLGCEFEFKAENNFLMTAPKKLKIPDSELNCLNSGTSTRLIAGVLAGQNFSSTLIGDESLSSRPMKRIIEPLSLMGAKIIHNNYKLPLKIQGRKLHGVEYKSSIPSAQVKSCILLAGLNASSKTIFQEPYESRNHTELMLKYLGANIKTTWDKKIIVEPSELIPKNIEISGDISSAAFFIAAGLLVPNSDITLRSINCNPTRTGIIDVVKKMGGQIKIFNKRIVNNEIVADINVKYSKLMGVKIAGKLIPRLIDEIPIIAVLMALAKGESEVCDAKELRFKESDRIFAITTELKKSGVKIKLKDDGFIIRGMNSFIGGVEYNSHKDHRIAMSLYVAGLCTVKPVLIKNFEWVDISFPEFLPLMESLKH